MPYRGLYYGDENAVDLERDEKWCFAKFLKQFSQKMHKFGVSTAIHPLRGINRLHLEEPFHELQGIAFMNKNVYCHFLEGLFEMRMLPCFFYLTTDAETTSYEKFCVLKQRY